MIAIAYPPPAFRTRTEGGKRYIFDNLRKTWLLLTGEEWVRQNFINYLTTGLHYPASFIALEKEIRVGELRRRFDILLYDPAHQPWMIVECKTEEVPLSESVLQQALHYNIAVPVAYLVITNGAQTIAWKKEGTELQLLSALPAWNGKS